MNEALGKEKTIDLVARRFIATSIAYYCLEESLVSDTVFDSWGVRLHEEWDDLSVDNKFKLGDPHAVRASGFHIKVTMKDLAGTSAWLQKRQMLRYQIGVAKWLPSEELKTNYTTLDNVHWARGRPIQ